MTEKFRIIAEFKYLNHYTIEATDLDTAVKAVKESQVVPESSGLIDIYIVAADPLGS